MHLSKSLTGQAITLMHSNKEFSCVGLLFMSSHVYVLVHVISFGLIHYF